MERGLKRVKVFIISMAVTAMLVLSGTIVSYADNSHGGTLGNGLYWTLTDNTLTVYGNGYMEDIDGYNTVPWFRYRDSVYRIVVGNGVRNIGAKAFSAMNKAVSVSIPDSVTSIGNQAFYSCLSLSSVILPDSITEIGGYTFQSCQSLKSIEIPPNVSVISQGTFSGCFVLESVRMPQNLNKVEPDAFKGCFRLSTVYYTGPRMFNILTTCVDSAHRIERSKHNIVVVKGRQATCSSSGLTDGKKCTICGAVITEQDTIPVAPYRHTWVTRKGRSATTTASGLTEGVQCSVCGTWLTPQEVIPKLKSSKSRSNGNTQSKKQNVKRPARVSIGSVKNTKGKKIQVKWKKSKNAKIYQVSYRIKGKKWTTKTVKGTSYTIKKLKRRKVYQIRVRGVRGNKYGAWSKIRTVRVVG